MIRTTGLAMLAVLLFSGMAAAQNADRERAFRTARFVEILDIDGNGTVSLAEILAEHSRLFAAADLDGDGTLSVNEFRRRGRLFQSLGTVTLFDMLDSNGDQTLSSEEINQPSRRWFSRYDLDGDGAMAAGELSQGGQSGGSKRRR
jgi:Ca2+-binding EF-hand superfamily protein